MNKNLSYNPKTTSPSPSPENGGGGFGIGTKSKRKDTLRLVFLLLVLSGCGSYDKVESLAYEQVKSLYMICNQKNTVQLERAADRIAEEHVAGKLSAQEAEWLEAIIDDARSGQWKVAATNCRQLMEAQVEH